MISCNYFNKDLVFTFLQRPNFEEETHTSCATECYRKLQFLATIIVGYLDKNAPDQAFVTVSCQWQICLFKFSNNQLEKL